MKIPKTILSLTEDFDKNNIDYRIAGGQAAVYYGLRKKAGDWDIAIKEVTPELKEIMKDHNFVEIPDTNSQSWEGPVLVDFIIADGEFYPTLRELGLRKVEGLKFVARSMMGYINWKDGKSAYQHLQRYREAIEDLELPQQVKEQTDLSRFKQLASLEHLRQVLALQKPLALNKENLVSFTLSKDLSKNQVFDFYQVDRRKLSKRLDRYKDVPLNIIIANVNAKNILVLSRGDNFHGLTKPYETPQFRTKLLMYGYDAIYWKKLGLLQVLTRGILSDIRVYDVAEFTSVIDKEKSKTERFVEPQEETAVYIRQEDARMKTSNVKKFARNNPIPGGYGDELDINDVDPEQLERGIEVEMEHVGENPELSEEEEEAISADIAYDHLEEIEDYYDWLDWMENLAKSGRAAAIKTSNKLIKLASKLDEEGLVLQAALLDRLLGEQKIVVANPATLEPSSTTYREQALKARRERMVNEVFTKVTGIPSSTIGYYKKIQPVLEKFHSLLESASKLDRGSLKYIEAIRYVTDKFNSVYDPYNTDHVPTKIKYILTALVIYDLVEKNVDKFATHERGVDEVINLLVEKVKETDVVKEFNKYKRALD